MKIIKEYQNYVNKLHTGKPADYHHILDMIYFIEVAHDLDNSNMLIKHFTHE